MENKNVGYMLLIISIMMIIMIFMFNSAMNSFVKSSCTLAHGGDYCPMYETIDKQTYLSLTLVVIIFLIGIFLIFKKPERKIIIKNLKKLRKYDLSRLKKEEIEVFNLVKENKAIFQAEIIEKTGFGKAKVTRVIDRLENSGLVERKRRGMTNIIVLKE